MYEASGPARNTATRAMSSETMRVPKLSAKQFVAARMHRHRGGLAIQPAVAAPIPIGQLTPVPPSPQ